MEGKASSKVYLTLAPEKREWSSALLHSSVNRIASSQWTEGWLGPSNGSDAAEEDMILTPAWN